MTVCSGINRAALKVGIALFVLLGGSCIASAQEVIDIYPANDHGKEITLPFAMSRDAYPKAKTHKWKVSPPELSYIADKDGLRLIKGGDTITVAVPEKDGILYGTIVSRNEFGIDKGVFPSPDAQKVAFYRKDESAVTEFPLLDITTRTGSLRSIRYPMNGMTSEIISLGVYDIASGSTVYIDVTDFTSERYLAGVSWSPDSRRIYIQVLDRPQHTMHLNVYDAASGKFLRTLITEHDDRWVEPSDQIHFIEGRNDLFLYTSYWKSAYRSLYLVDTLGAVRILPSASADVKYVANNGRSVFYTSSGNSALAEKHLFRIDLKIPAKDAHRKTKFSKPVQLTSGAGWHEIAMSPEMDAFADYYTAFKLPREVRVKGTYDGRDSLVYTAADPLKDYIHGEVEFGTVPSADGRYCNYYRLLRPAGFDPAKKYPVVVYVYGGPHSQMVSDSWLGKIRMWEMYMSSHGYIVYVQDNRGTSERGEAYEKAINRRCGAAEMEDQMVGVKMLSSLPYVDSERIGVHGWSYGGYMTISLMTTYPEVFKVGVAGGPVIDWKWYEVMYGERYMDTPETNPEGFSATSLINKASNLKGKLLICQGMVDNTVVPQHCLNFVQTCIDLGTQLDFFPYPVAEHNVFGPNRVHLMQKVTDYFDDNL